MNYTTYKYELTALSPVFIGDGNEITRITYVVDDREKKIHVIDSGKFIETLKKNNKLDQYMSAMNAKNNNSIESFISHEAFRYAKPSKSYSIDYINSDFNEKYKNNIKTFIKDIYGNPYIPGSSIKGAIVSSIADLHVYNKDKNLSQEMINEVPDRYNRKKIKLKEQQFNNKAYLNESKFKYLNNLSISDSEPIEKSLLTLVKKIDFNILANKNSTQKMPLYRESLKSDTKIRFSITVNEKIPIEEIEEAIKLRFNLIYGDNGIITGAYPDAKKFIPDRVDFNKINLVLGGGTGFHTKTNLMAICGGHKAGNEKAKEILNAIFGNHNLNSVISPRCLKIDYKNKFLGICELKRIE